MTERDSRAIQMAAWNRLWAILLRVPDDAEQVAADPDGHENITPGSSVDPVASEGGETNQRR